MPRVPIVLQTAETDCGPACLTALLRWQGIRVNLIDLRTDMDPGRDGSSGMLIRQTGQRWGLPLQAQLVDPKLLASRINELPLPLLLHLSRQHYVIVDRVRAHYVEIMDPAVGRRRMTRQQLAVETSGLVLFMGATDESTTPTILEPQLRANPTNPPKVLGALLRSVRSALTAAGALSVLLAVGGLAVPVTTAFIVDALVADEVDPHRWLAIGVALACVVGLLTLARDWTLATLQRRMAGKLSTSVATTLFSRTLKFFDRRSVGDLFGRVESAHAIHALLSVTLLGAGLDALLTVGYLIALWVIAPALAGATAGMIVVCLVVSGLIARRSANLRREEILVTADSSTLLVDSIDGMSTLRAYGAETPLLDTWQKLLDRRLQLTQSRARLNGLAVALLAAMSVATPLIILILAASPALSTNALETVTPGAALGLMALAAATLAPVSSLAIQVVSAAELRPLLDRVQDLMLAEPVRTHGTDPGKLTGALQLENVSFRHERHGRDVIRNITATVAAGSTVCLLGPTGCGKSTLAQLMAGLHEPTEGQLFFDGHNLHDLQLATLRSHIGVVLQDSWAPAGTIRDAVLMSRTRFTDDDIWRALRQAQLAEEIAALPLGLDTRLGSGGTGLSGGQRQRLALARALLGQPKILILDEPTSALDGDTEQAIETTLRKQAITRIIVTHRLSIASTADQLWVMADGALTVHGSPTELASGDGWFARLLAAQRTSFHELTPNTPLG